MKKNTESFFDSTFSRVHLFKTAFVAKRFDVWLRALRHTMCSCGKPLNDGYTTYLRHNRYGAEQVCGLKQNLEENSSRTFVIRDLLNSR